MDGRLFISCGNFGIALKLPQKVLNDLFIENKAKPLKYFPNGHIKKEYAVLSKQILEDKQQLKKLLNTSIRVLKPH